MLINHKKKFLFVHVPKTGGISIRNIISKIPDTFTLNPPHGGVEFVREMFGNLDKYYKFTIVRNPFDWYMSFFSFKGSSWSHDVYTPEDKKNFQKWINGLLDIDTDIDSLRKNKKNIIGGLDFKFLCFLLENNKKIKNAGWLTHLLIYSCCLNFKDILEKKIDHICNNIDKYFYIDAFVPTEEIGNIENYLNHSTLKEHLNNYKMQHFNKGDYNKNEFSFDDNLKKKIYDREALAFEIYNRSLKMQK